MEKFESWINIPDPQHWINDSNYITRLRQNKYRDKCSAGTEPGTKEYSNKDINKVRWADKIMAIDQKYQ